MDSSGDEEGATPVPWQTAEEEELEILEAELKELQNGLASAELGVATEQGRLEAFERRYLVIVGPALARMEELRALHAAREADRLGTDEAAGAAVEAARQAAETAMAVEGAAVNESGFLSSDPLRDAFRRVARLVHPDLADTDEARVGRTRVMAEVNNAYRDGDLERLLRLELEWRNDPQAITGNDVAADLVRALRRRAQVRRRLREIEAERLGFSTGPLAELRRRAEEVEECGGDLLADLVKQLQRQIKDLERELEQCRRGTGDG